MSASTSSAFRRIGFLVFKTIVGLLFIATGLMKLAAQPMLVHEFDLIGLGQGFRIVTGLIEVGAGVLLMVPQTWRFASVALLAVSVGACIAQATRLHGDVIHTLVLIAATGFFVWSAWGRHTTPAAATLGT